MWVQFCNQNKNQILLTITIKFIFFWSVCHVCYIYFNNFIDIKVHQIISRGQQLYIRAKLAIKWNIQDDHKIKWKNLKSTMGQEIICHNKNSTFVSCYFFFQIRTECNECMHTSSKTKTCFSIFYILSSDNLVWNWLNLTMDPYTF